MKQYQKMYEGERFNSYTHLIGVILACVAASLLLAIAIEKSDAIRIIGFSIYGAIQIALYSVSTIYHSTRGEKKKFFQLLDYLSIYLMIAGSYTPFTLLVLPGGWGWTLFGAVWALALIGIAQELWIGKRTRRYSLIIYMIMGWLVLVALKPLINSLPLPGFIWLVSGGLAYTLGVGFFLLDEKIKHFHGIWHICVMLGSFCQFICLYKFVA
ncbi:MAG: channel protein hemolysin family [Pseudobdellovibrio sp.]|jgi:hemolysin III|nr:channel protein hemolysin family [Pseudobdellovibrio sp.]